MTTPKLFWLFSLAILLLQAALAYPDLPDRMVTHMNLKGTPDGYGSKDEFFLAFGLAVLVINIMPPLVPLLMRRLPASLVNLPNKEYWFADTVRKAKSIDHVYGMMALTMGLVNVMFILILQQVIDLSAGKESSIPLWTIWLIVAVLIFLPVVYLLWVLRVPDQRTS